MRRIFALFVSCFVFVACPIDIYWSNCTKNLTSMDLYFIYDSFPNDNEITPDKNQCVYIKALDSARVYWSGRIERTIKDSLHIYVIDASFKSLPNWTSLSKDDITGISNESILARMTVFQSESDFYWNFPSSRQTLFFNGYSKDSFPISY